VNRSRRDLLRSIARGAWLAGLGGVAAWLGLRPAPTVNADTGSGPGRPVWQLDPALCVQCGRCATECVLTPSAVKCVHSYPICGYCKLCFGYFQPGAPELTEAAENQLCPTGALTRRFLEAPYYEYAVDESLCVGCSKCVAGCTAFGNGSLHLQVRHDRCANCNECSIARACPSGAYRRLPAGDPYLLKGKA